MELLNIYTQANKINSLAVLLGSIPVTRHTLKKLGIKKDSLTEKAILISSVVIVGKLLFATK
ncbi:MAG: hypothetical protein COA44_15215 [Arcobacter sp.]|nr:MAG: hypothetical protein COA44_15215 [Arcobacter sp.]